MEERSLNTSIQQGLYHLSNYILLVLDRVMRRMEGGRKRKIQQSMRDRLEDLDYADDICILAHRFKRHGRNTKMTAGRGLGCWA